MPVCIAGMHRSGTSMVASLLHAAGLYLGIEADVLPGLKENRRFNNVNQRILKQLGGNWDEPPPIPNEWAGSGFDRQRAEVRALFAHFANHEPWGWKDPRTCLTLPFWQELLGPMRVVIVVRNPLEVAESLQQRNDFSTERGMSLWYEYNCRLLAAAGTAERIVTHYDAYFEHPDREARRLLNFLGLPLDADSMATVSGIRRTNRRHHRHTRRDLIAAGLPPSVLDLYSELCQAAEWSDSDRASADPPGKAI
jgi:hypothetical protein